MLGMGSFTGATKWKVKKKPVSRTYNDEVNTSVNHVLYSLMIVLDFNESELTSDTFYCLLLFV